MSNTKDIPFSPPWQISNLEEADQPEATGLDARRMERLHAGADNYLIKRFDKNELLARFQVGLCILELYSSLAELVKELEKAAGDVDDLKLRSSLGHDLLAQADRCVARPNGPTIAGPGKHFFLFERVFTILKVAFEKRTDAVEFRTRFFVYRRSRLEVAAITHLLQFV